MKAFGLELRRQGVTALYNDVDRILARVNQPDVQRMGVAHALQDMMSVDKWFSVCTVRDCAKLCRIVIPAEREALYQTAHCINWNKMMPEYRETLMAFVLDDFRTVLNPEPLTP